MYSAVPKTGSTLIHWALSVLGEKYNNFKVVGFRYMPMYEDTFIGHIKHDYFYSECNCGCERARGPGLNLNSCIFSITAVGFFLQLFLQNLPFLLAFNCFFNRGCAFLKASIIVFCCSGLTFLVVDKIFLLSEDEIS